MTRLPGVLDVPLKMCAAHTDNVCMDGTILRVVFVSGIEEHIIYYIVTTQWRL